MNLIKQIKPKNLPYIELIALFAVAFIAYFPCLRGGFIFDDFQLIEMNQGLIQPDGLNQIWTNPKLLPEYYPLTHTSYWLDWKLWQFDYKFSHLVNIGLHVLCAYVLVGVLRRLNFRGAWAAGLLFVLHPMCVESVAWLSQRKTTLSALFFLLTIRMFLGFLESKHRNDYIIAVICFIAGLLSKTAILFLPVVLLALYWYRERKLELRAWMLSAPFFALSIGATIYTMALEHSLIRDPAIAARTLTEKISVAGALLWTYAIKIVAPLQYALIYPKWTVDSSSVLWYLPTVAAMVLACALFAFRHRGTAAAWITCICFIASLLPVIGIVYFQYFRFSYYADHFAYLAILILVSSLVCGITHWLSPRKNGLNIGYGILAVVAVGFGALTMRNAETFSSNEFAWSDTIEKNPSCVIAHNNLAGEYVKQNLMDRAVEEFQKSLAVDPNSMEALGGLSSILAVSDDPLIRDPVNAEKYSKKLCDLHGRSADNLYNYAGALAANHKYSEELTVLREALVKAKEEGRADLEEAIQKAIGAR